MSRLSGRTWGPPDVQLLNQVFSGPVGRHPGTDKREESMVEVRVVLGQKRVPASELAP